MSGLAGQHAFVTGASRGIGAAIADLLASAGARVTRTALHARDGVLACDVTDPRQVDGAMARAEERYGAIGILVNNAGIATSNPFLKTGGNELDSLLAVNLKGAWHCSQRALPAMLAAGRGRIINIASLAALEGYPYVSAYCVAKHALAGLTRALAAEFCGRGIAVCAVCPGYVETDMLGATIANIQRHTGLAADETRHRVAALNPGGCILDAAEVAATVLDLCLAAGDLANGRIVSLPLPHDFPRTPT